MAHRSLVIAVLATAVVTAAPVFAQSITAVRSSIKIRPTDNPPSQAAITLHAAGNEFEAFQVVVFGGPPPGLSGVTVTLPTLTQGSASIPASEVRLYHEGTLKFTNRSSPEGASGQWRDPLIPAQEDGLAVQNSNGAWSLVTSVGEQRNEFPISVAPNQNEVVWIDIHVPPTQTPGAYQGTLKVLSGTTLDQGTWAHLVDGTFPVLVTGNVTDYTNCTSGSPAVNILCPLVDFVDGQGQLARSDVTDGARAGEPHAGLRQFPGCELDQSPLDVPDL